MAVDWLFDANMHNFLRVALALVTSSGSLLAVSEAYPRTAPGDLELKTLPPARWMRTESAKDYFDSDNGLFMKLFRYIDSNRIPMTAPVEAGIKPGTMVFYMDQVSAKRADLAETPLVKLSSVPERRVAAIGIRGSYSRVNYEEALVELRAWLAKRTDVKPAGQPYAVYWNSPFVPFFLKQSEVHIPVAQTK
ncbi:MAG: heme-binding protein [Verrucomicrobiota bacterium]